jgi:hypothetical protein
MKAQVRYNHESKNNYDKWRLLIDDEEKIVSEVLFECATITTCDKVEVNGEMIDKFHLSAIDAEEYITEHGGNNFIRVIIF